MIPFLTWLLKLWLDSSRLTLLLVVLLLLLLCCRFPPPWSVSDNEGKLLPLLEEWATERRLPTPGIFSRAARMSSPSSWGRTAATATAAAAVAKSSSSLGVFPLELFSSGDVESMEVWPCDECRKREEYFFKMFSFCLSFSLFCVEDKLLLKARAYLWEDSLSRPVYISLCNIGSWWKRARVETRTNYSGLLR